MDNNDASLCKGSLKNKAINNCLNIVYQKSTLYSSLIAFPIQIIANAIK